MTQINSVRAGFVKRETGVVYDTLESKLTNCTVVNIDRYLDLTGGVSKNTINVCYALLMSDRQARGFEDYEFI
jgi:hypothetical protein